MKSRALKTAAIPTTIIAICWMCAGCDKSSLAPTSPSSSTGGANTASAVTFTIGGLVADTAQRPLPAVTVAMTDGPSAGQTAMTGDDGRFAFAPFSAQAGTLITLELSRDGYSPTSIRVGNGVGRYLRLHPVSVAHLEGAFRMTLIADAGCTDLPAALRTRSYEATVEQSDTSVTIGLAGGEFAAHYDTFLGSLGNNDARFFVASKYASDAWLEDDPIIERLDRATYLAVDGTATADITSSNPSSISAILNGSISYCAAAQNPVRPDLPPTCSAPLVQCQSAAHQLQLTRR
jgi:hypothetical protein